VPLAFKLAERGDTDTKRQLKRAALSINLNIAEGIGRRGDDRCQFYRIARGSALEAAAVLDALDALGVLTRRFTTTLTLMFTGLDAAVPAARAVVDFLPGIRVVIGELEAA
jgi:four helix bundle protein